VAAEHTTSAMALRYYINGRKTISKAAAVVDRAYSASCKKFAAGLPQTPLRRKGLKYLGPL